MAVVKVSQANGGIGSVTAANAAGLSHLSWPDRSEQGAKPSTRQRTSVVDPGDRRQLRPVRCIRLHFRKRHTARKPCEENLVHSAVQSAVDRGVRHVVFKQ